MIQVVQKQHILGFKYKQHPSCGRFVGLYQQLACIVKIWFDSEIKKHIFFGIKYPLEGMLYRHHQDYLWIIPTPSGNHPNCRESSQVTPNGSNHHRFFWATLRSLKPHSSSRVSGWWTPNFDDVPDRWSGLSIWQTHGVEHVSQHDKGGDGFKKKMWRWMSGLCLNKNTLHHLQLEAIPTN